MKTPLQVDTDLYEFCKNKTHLLNMTVSPRGDRLVTVAADRKIRIFKIQTGESCSNTILPGQSWSDWCTLQGRLLL
jgi:WD40 repeat protein